MSVDEPEPDKEAMAPSRSTILDTKDATHSAYLWESHNCKEGWLAFNGDLLPVEQ